MTDRLIVGSQSNRSMQARDLDHGCEVLSPHDRVDARTMALSLSKLGYAWDEPKARLSWTPLAGETKLCIQSGINI